MASIDTNAAGDPAILALNALIWVLGDPARATRFVDLTGLSPTAIRARADDPALLAAVIDHLAGHEPDLVACAAATDTSPDALIRAGYSLRTA